MKIYPALLALLMALCPLAEARKPNFIVIFIDDLGYGDIGPFGSEKNETPHLDRMAKEGMKLTSFYLASSGMYPFAGCSHDGELSAPGRSGQGFRARRSFPGRSSWAAPQGDYYCGDAQGRRLPPRCWRGGHGRATRVRAMRAQLGRRPPSCVLVRLGAMFCKFAHVVGIHINCCYKNAFSRDRLACGCTTGRLGGNAADQTRPI